MTQLFRALAELAAMVAFFAAVYFWWVIAVVTLT